jgi:serine/threonine protein kinase
MQKYMSPEQVKGERSDPQSDQYSLGLTYFLLLTSRHFVRHQTQLVPDPNTVGATGVSAGCVEVIRRMLSKEPSQRFENIERVRNVLKGLMPKA